MLEKLFARNRLQKRNPEENGSWRKIAEGDYQRYMFYEELFRKIVATEAALHNMEDPTEIAIGVMKAACDLYEGDWSGILIADLHSQLWRPEIWYDIHTGPMTETLFHEFEMTEEYLTWVKHLKEQEPLVIKDVEAIRESSPGEYAAYKRLETHAVIGVPFGQHPLGFMVIRNMKQYTDRPEPLQLACFVAMMMLEQIRRTRMENLTKMHDEDDGRFRIRYNILGPHNFVIDGKEIYEQDLPHPNRRAWIIMLYMVLHKRPVDQQKLIEDNWPDEEVDTARNNMRQAIFRLHNDLAAYHDVKVIDTRSRMMDFSGEVNVTTDADEMEDLYNRAKNLPDGDDKIILLKKAFELYRGRLFIQGEDDIGTWLYTYTTHYNQVYVDLTSALLTTLGHIKDYRCIMDYGPRALEIEPGILTAYYWIIIAADETGNSMAREKFLQKAAEDLIDEENEKLMKLLALQNHMS
jgi:DNA-binding SARP family transcriptional activator